MNKKLFPLCIIFLCVIGGLLSSRWFSSENYKTKEEIVERNSESNIDANPNQFQDVLTIDELVKQYNTSNKLTPPTINEPVNSNKEENIIVTTSDNNKMASFQNMFFNVVGSNQVIQAEPFDGSLGTASLEIYNKNLKGFYKLRYIYTETGTMLKHSVELNYAVGADPISATSFSLDEIHRVLTGVSIEPYVLNQINVCLENYRKVAQINATTATDSNKTQYQDFSSHNVQYRISTIGNIVTVSGTLSTNK